MKKIIIYQENNEPVILFDNDKSELSSYKENIYDIFNSTKIIELEINNEITLLRPSKINLIRIFEVNENVLTDKQEENIITDGE